LYKTVSFDVTYEFTKSQNGQRYQIRSKSFFAHNTGIPKPKTARGKPAGRLEWINTFTGPVGSTGNNADGESDDEDNGNTGDAHLAAGPQVTVHRDTTSLPSSGQEVDHAPAGSTMIDFKPAMSVPSDLHVHGAALAQSFFQLSDSRYKFDIQDLVDSLEVIQSLKGKKFRWKPNALSPESETTKSPDSLVNGKRVLGFIAQEVQKVLPGAVTASKSEGYLAIDCSQLVPILIEGFKHQVKVHKLSYLPAWLL